VGHELCSSCAPQYDACVATSYSCMKVLDCIERTHCVTMVDCNQPTTCQCVMDGYGRDPGVAVTITNILSCMQNAGCTMSCAPSLG